MITTEQILAEQILAATGEELERLLGEILQPEPLLHEIRTKWAGDPPMKDPPTVCQRCGLLDPDKDDACFIYPSIPLTWPNAMKWRDWAVEEYGVFNYLYILKNSLPSSGRKGRTPQEFIMALAKPEHYLRAAAICEIGAE